jgi:hypothetical protein
MNENMLPVGTQRLAKHPAEEYEDQLEIHRALGQDARDQTRCHQQVGAHAGGKEFK